MTRIGSYLFKRNERSYYVRIAVPKALRNAFGVREIKRKLPTSHLQVARLQASYISSEILDTFEKVRRNMLISVNTHNQNHYDIQALNPECKTDLSKLFNALKMNSLNHSHMLEAAEEVFETKIKTQTRMKFLEYFEKMRQLKLEGKHWSLRCAADFNAIVDTFVEILGDRYMDEYDYNDAQTFFSTVSKLPSRRKTLPEFRDLSIGETLRLKPEPMSPTTINKYMDRIQQVFTEASHRDLIQKNYFDNPNLRMKDLRSVKKLRENFERDELRLIFQGDLFQTPDPSTIQTRWALLLLLYTGARANEICQLHVKDIQCRDGIWFVEHVNCCPQKSFKREAQPGATERYTPLHQELIELGFLEYMESVKAKNSVDKHGHLRLFPSFSHSEKHGYSRKISRFFNGAGKGNGYKHQIGLKSKLGQSRLDLHSFRHTLATELYQADVPREIGFEITGHSSNKNAGDRYIKYALLEQLQTHLNKISFKDVLLPSMFVKV